MLKGHALPTDLLTNRDLDESPDSPKRKESFPPKF